MKITRDEVIAQAYRQKQEDDEHNLRVDRTNTELVKTYVNSHCTTIFFGFDIENCEDFKINFFHDIIDWRCSFVYDGFTFSLRDGGERFAIYHEFKLYIKRKRWGWKKIKSAEQFLKLVEKGKV